MKKDPNVFVYGDSYKTYIGKHTFYLQINIQISYLKFNSLFDYLNKAQ